jgi:hypothetical protein
MGSILRTKKSTQSGDRSASKLICDTLLAINLRGRTWRELHIERLRSVRASFVGIQFALICLDAMARTAALRNGRMWPVTSPHVELNLHYLLVV